MKWLTLKPGGETMQEEGENGFAQYHEEVCAALRALGEPERVREAQNDKKSGLEFLAVRVPAIEQVVRRGFSFYEREEPEILAIWNQIWFGSPFFEVMSAAAMYYGLQGARIDPATWPTLAGWSSRIENWAHADHLASIYSYILAQRTPEVYRQLQEWNASDGAWLRRISLISLIHYTGKKAIFLRPEQVLPLVAHCIRDERYYVQKAVGWVLREMGLVYPQAIDDFLHTHMADMPGIAFSRAIERRTGEERAVLRAARKRARG